MARIRYLIIQGFFYETLTAKEADQNHMNVPYIK